MKEAFWFLFFFLLFLSFFNEIFGKPSKIRPRKKKILLENALALKSSPDFTSDNIRMLPGNLKPTFYYISIQPYFEAPGLEYESEKDQTFDGYIQIYMDVVKPTSTIILNAHELVFSAKKNFKVFSYFPPSNGSAVVNVLGWKESPESEAIIINLERKLKEDEKIVIIITYSGKIGVNSETGFYKSVKDGDIVYATMFQTTGARSVFPCFDEPEYKAEFKIEIAKPKTWTALSNTMEENIKDLGDGYDRVTFEKTQKISTYMVAFAIGDLVKIEGKTADGILTRIWTFRSGKNQMKAGLESAIKCTEVMTKYTNFPLKFKKMDHLAIPEMHYFAMENPGLVIYDQIMLLLEDDEEISYNNPEAFNQWYRISSTICHEMAHQWFGNLLTNKWWGDSWLHEGFANYYESFAFSKAFPKQKDIIDIRAAAAILKKVVGLANPEVEDHPVITKNGEFDQITYYKGGAVLRQLEAVISPKVFQKAIQNYIKIFANSNVNSDDFLQKIQESVDETELKDWCGEPFNVSKFMDLWLNEISYPYLQINFINGTFVMTQNNVLKTWWPLPIFVQYENDKRDMIWLAPNYMCKDGRKLPTTKIIKSSTLFINPDLLFIAKMKYSVAAAETIYKALISSDKTLQISPASLAIFYDRIEKNVHNYDHIYDEIFSHQKSAKIYDFSQSLKMYD